VTRLLAIAAVLVAAAAAAVLSGAGGEDDGVVRHRVVLDSAFGLTEGSDLRAAGVNVGQIEDLEVESRTARAVATIRVERPEFGGPASRRDVRHRAPVAHRRVLHGLRPGPRPRAPARRPAPSRSSGRAARSRPTSSTTCCAAPYRERLGIIIAELGAAFAARGDDVNATIARAIPALRETDRVLRVLGDERQTLRELTRDSERVLTALAGNREGVARFVREARDTAVASADRRTELAATVRDLPRFQRELRPTLDALGRAARLQTPALQDLRPRRPR
jgi:ABC-type transporter Mla subunit MlaD